VSSPNIWILPHVQKIHDKNTKSNVIPVTKHHAVEVNRGRGGNAYRIRNVGTRRRWMAKPTCRLLCSRGNRRPSRWTGGWAFLRICLDVVATRIIPVFAGNRATLESLFWLIYLGSLCYVSYLTRRTTRWNQRETENINICPYDFRGSHCLL
jgi:hypothetical protein